MPAVTPHTVATAVTRLREDFLDDPKSKRWTDAQLKRELRGSIGKCLREYTDNGGRRFLKPLLAQTTDASGQIEMSTVDPLWIHSVLISEGGRKEEIPNVDVHQQEYSDDNETRTVDIFVIPNIVFNDDDAEVLIQPDALSLGTWDAFEEWVIARAALGASRKNLALIASLQRDHDDAARAVLGVRPVNPIVDFTEPARAYPHLRRTLIGTKLTFVRTLTEDGGF